MAQSALIWAPCKLPWLKTSAWACSGLAQIVFSDCDDSFRSPACHRFQLIPAQESTVGIDGGLHRSVICLL